MGVFGAPSAKRHCGWSNDEGFIGQLVAEGGYLSKREREAVTSAKLTRSYVDEQGRRKFVGQKLQLKHVASALSSCERTFSGLRFCRQYPAKFGAALARNFRGRKTAACPH